MAAQLTPRSTVVVVKDQVSCDLTDEVAILQIKKGMYYGLDSVGRCIWNLIQQPRSVAEVRDAIMQEYDVEPERCERDLLALFQQMADEDLIEIRASEDSCQPVGDSGSPDRNLSGN